MLNGIFNKRLQHHRRHLLFKCILVNIIFNLEPVLETHVFQGQVIFYNFEFIPELNGLSFLCFKTAAKDIA